MKETDSGYNSEDDGYESSTYTPTRASKHRWPNNNTESLSLQGMVSAAISVFFSCIDDWCCFPSRSMDDVEAAVSPAYSLLEKHNVIVDTNILRVVSSVSEANEWLGKER